MLLCHLKGAELMYTDPQSNTILLLIYSFLEKIIVKNRIKEDSCKFIKNIFQNLNKNNFYSLCILRHSYDLLSSDG